MLVTDSYTSLSFLNTSEHSTSVFIIVSGSETIKDDSSQNNKDIIPSITKCKSRPQLPKTTPPPPPPLHYPISISFAFLAFIFLSNSDNVTEKMSF